MFFWLNTSFGHHVQSDRNYYSIEIQLWPKRFLMMVKIIFDWTSENCISKGRILLWSWRKFIHIESSISTRDHPTAPPTPFIEKVRTQQVFPINSNYRSPRETRRDELKLWAVEPLIFRWRGRPGPSSRGSNDDDNDDESLIKHNLPLIVLIVVVDVVVVVVVIVISGAQCQFGKGKVFL